jgi:hypothetical protein
MRRRRVLATRRAAQPLCHHGQHRAAMTRRPSGGFRRGGRVQEVHASTSNEVGTLGQGLAAWAVDSESTRARARLGARRQACHPRAHHDGSCLVATLAWAMLSGVATVECSLQLCLCFGLGWTELRGIITNRF